VQLGNDFEKCFVMFDYVKKVKSWANYRLSYLPLYLLQGMTIVVYDMQIEGTKGKFIFGIV